MSSPIEVTFMGHACAEIRCGKTTIITDPWLKGTAFLGGWQRKYDPPPDYEERLIYSDIIYVSHSHSDHMSAETLSGYDMEPIAVPDFASKSAEKEARRLGIQSVVPTRLGVWNTLNDVRWMILPDTSGRDDSGLLVEYKGKYLINTVDCNMPNGLDLPRENVDWLLAPWSAGASPYPYCYEEMLGLEKTRAIAKRNNVAALERLKRLLKLTHPVNYMPFAGFAYATNPHIEELIDRNPVEQAEAAAMEHGAVVAVSDLKPAEKEEFRYKFPMRVDAKEFFEKCGFRGGLRLEIAWKDESFSHSFAECIYQETRIEVAPWLFAYVIHNGIPWDEMAIGYHAKLSRCPDHYEEEFWSHFQNNLPQERPWASS